MMVFGMTWPGHEPMTYSMRGEHANHQDIQSQSVKRAFIMDLPRSELTASEVMQYRWPGSHWSLGLHAHRNVGNAFIVSLFTRFTTEAPVNIERKL